MEDFTNLTKEATLNFLIKLLQSLRFLEVDASRIESLKQLIINIAGVDTDGLLLLTDEQYDIFIGDEDEGETSYSEDD